MSHTVPQTGKIPDHKHVPVSKRLAAINSASSVATRLLNVTILLWVYQFLLKRLPPQEFAVYPVMMALMAFAPLFFSFLTGGVSRYTVDAYALGDHRRVTEIASSMVSALAAFSALFLTVGIIINVYLDDLLTIPPSMINEAQVMLYLLLASFAAQMVLMPLTVGFHVKQQFVLLNLLGIARDLLRIVLVLVFLFVISPRVVWVVVASVMADSVYLLATVLWSRKILPALMIQVDAISWKTAIDLTGFGLWTTLGRLGNMMYTNAATIILNKMGSPFDIVNFYLGATLFRQIQATIGVALLPLQPALTAMNALDDRSRLANTFLRSGRYALWASLAAACPLGIYSVELVQLYLGNGFIGASYVIFLFMVTFPFTQPTALLPMSAMATAKVRAYFSAAFIVQLIGLALMLYWVGEKEMGAAGATASLAIITVGSQLIYFWPLSLRIANVPLRRFARETLLRGYAPALAGSCAWVALKYLVEPASWGSVLLCGGAGMVVYLITLLSSCLDEYERQDLHSILSKLRHKRVATGAQ